MEKTVSSAMQLQNFLQWTAVTFAHQINPSLRDEVQGQERIFLEISPVGMMTAKMNLEELVNHNGSQGKGQEVLIEVATQHPPQITEQERGTHTILAAAAIRKTMELWTAVSCQQLDLAER